MLNNTIFFWQKLLQRRTSISHHLCFFDIPTLYWGYGGKIYIQWGISEDARPLSTVRSVGFLQTCFPDSSETVFSWYLLLAGFFEAYFSINKFSCRQADAYFFNFVLRQALSSPISFASLLFCHNYDTQRLFFFNIINYRVVDRPPADFFQDYNHQRSFCFFFLVWVLRLMRKFMVNALM